MNDEMRVGTPKDGMRIVCCGCGEPTDLPTVTKLVDAHPTCLTYRATCKCGFTHMVRVTRN